MLSPGSALTGEDCGPLCLTLPAADLAPTGQDREGHLAWWCVSRWVGAVTLANPTPRCVRIVEPSAAGEPVVRDLSLTLQRRFWRRTWGVPCPGCGRVVSRISWPRASCLRCAGVQEAPSCSEARSLAEMEVWARHAQVLARYKALQATRAPDERALAVSTFGHTLIVRSAFDPAVIASHATG